MKIFLIGPVRQIDTDTQQQIQKYVDRQESRGNTVYWPLRDTDQYDPTGYRIMSDNLIAISDSHQVHIWYDPHSKGSIADLGMAFALGKRLKTINKVEPTQSKSIANWIREWEQRR
jgi:hypothetical protein